MEKNLTEAGRRDLKLFSVYLGAGLLIYWKQISQVLANPDAIWNSTIYKSNYGEYTMGRFLIPVLQNLKGDVVNTAISSILCLIFICLGCVLIVHLYGCTDAFALLTGLLIVISPNTGCVLTYYYCSEMYALSFLAVTAAACLLFRKGSGWKEVLCAVLLTTISAGIYQAYLGVLITLCLLKGMQLIFRQPVLGCVRQAVRSLGSIACGILLYLLVSRMAAALYGGELTENRGFSSMGELQLRTTLSNIRLCYHYFVRYFFGTQFINNSVGFRREFNFLYFLVLAAGMVAAFVTMRVLWRRIALVLLSALLPLAVMIIVVIAPEANVLNTTGVLMLPTCTIIYLAAGIVWKETASYRSEAEDVHSNEAVETGEKQPALQQGGAGARMWPRWLCLAADRIVLAVMILTIYWSGVLVAQGQSYLEYCSRKMKYVAESMAEAIEDAVDDSSSYKLYIAGYMEDGNYPDKYTALRESLHWTTYYHRTVWGSLSGSQGVWSVYFRDYLGVNYEMCSVEECESIAGMGVLDSMDDFPDSNSVTVVDDQYIVIKLSD